MAKDYVYGTTPFAKQEEAFLLSRDQLGFALLMEQGTGKSKVAIDTSAWLWNTGRVSGLFIVAPNGVHRNWVVNEIPKHMPEYIAYDMAAWSANPNSEGRKALGSLARMDRPALKILAMNVEALSTAKGLEMAKTFLRTFRSIMVVDESTTIKNHKAKRTEAVLTLGKLAAYRRVLTGTPVTQSPMDIFTQFAFLDDQIFAGTSSYYAFKARYCHILEDPGSLVGLRPHEARQVQMLRKIRSTPQGRRVQLEAKDERGRPMYQRLDELTRIIAPYSFRTTKDECLDLPPKLFRTRYVELSDNQRQLYDSLRKDLTTEFRGQTMSTPLALTKILRLQQIVGGFFCPDPEVYLDEDGELVSASGRRPVPQAIDKNNPRILAFLDELQNAPGKVIGWARFRAEIEALVEAINREFGEGYAAALYGGSGSRVADDRQEIIRRYENETFPLFVIANPQAKGVSRGQTMVRGDTVGYYSNSFSLEDRLQSEDRAHRHGQVNKVTYTDYVAPDTIDDLLIMPALRSKKDVADLITGDKWSQWI